MRQRVRSATSGEWTDPSAPPVPTISSTNSGERLANAEAMLATAASTTLSITGVMSSPVPSPSMYGMIGSSGTFTVALLKALYSYTHHFHDALRLAEDACDIEMNKLGAPVGKQDQYIASFGGITSFHFLSDGRVEVEPLQLGSETLANLEDNLLLFFTGYTRSAGTILKEQDQKLLKIAQDMGLAKK